MKCARVGCANDVMPRTDKHRFCSRRCARRARSKPAFGTEGPVERRLCAYAACREPFAPRRNSHRFCSTRCGVRSYNAIPTPEKSARRATKVLRHPNTALIHELRQEVGPMRCIYCEVPLRSVKAYICKDKECRTSYMRDYAAILRKRAKEARPAPTERQCKCGCGEPFVPSAGGQLYARTSHTRKHGQKLWREERKRLRATNAKKPRGPSILFGAGRALPGGTYAAG